MSSKFPTSNYTITSKRLGICLSCEMLWKLLPTFEQCAVCFCFVREKVKYQNESCPLSKW
ncbi:hypothetical protein EHO65_07370 [Leptospira andrefontaineae]|uniref:Uncharacterized protein n=1 Tax=Leptospira andrefontaineae TaxID=2484976 RepID=A0A4V3JG79_9LEPT|nr:hypothetical protein EHO65_07370 [Leptospira andrefontaineae]